VDAADAAAVVVPDVARGLRADRVARRARLVLPADVADSAVAEGAAARMKMPRA
jgi:hypothetical protein